MYSASEKLAIIRLVEDSELSIRRTLVEINVSRSSFYRWYRLMNVMALMACRTTAGHHANTGTRYPTRYGNWWLMWPWISRS